MKDERDNIFEEENKPFENETEETRSETKETTEEIHEEKRESSSEILKDYIDNTIEKEYNKRLKQNKKSNFAKMLLVVVLTSALSSGVTGWYFKNNKNSNVIQNGTNAITINSSESMSIENAVAKKATPSVVGITTIGVSEDMFLRQTESGGLGSGVIVSSDGYILTNHHVANTKSTKEATVILNDGTKHKAEILWSDKTLDLAVIKIDATGLNLQAVELADSSEVNIGDKAIAIGSPLGINLQSTLTSGYISGKDRVITLKDGSTMEGLLQTDAAINPGNSGGALLNSKGQLIGINNAKASNSDGIGFSIPINIAKPILEQIIKTGKFEAVMLGIRGIDVSRYNVLSEEKLGVNEGVYVHETVQGSPADEAGIKSGDIITKVGEHKVTSNSNLKTALLNYKLGDKVVVEINRNGEVKNIEVNFSKFN